jgi:RND family efflux transporter MFP subunit
MRKSAKWILHIFVALALLGAGTAGMGVLKGKKAPIKRQEPTAPPPLVRTMEVRTAASRITIQSQGTVRPLREIILVPQVAGKVVYLSPALVNGGEFKKGETLLRIEPDDYRLAVTLAQAKVKDAESKLKLLEAEAAAAREEWRIHKFAGQESAGEPPPLVVKKPQLLAAQAKLEADQADLKKAQLNLARTRIRAAFNGRVSQENVGLGQYVVVGQKLATLYATEAVEIVLPVEKADLAWFHVPGFTPGEGPGSKATVSAAVAGKHLRWDGRVVRAQGTIDERTRMIRVVVRVEKPYAEKPPLAIGLFVNVAIEGDVLPGSTVIPRAALRQGDVVWVVEEGRLRFRPVEVARIDGDRVLIESGLRGGEEVVLTPVKAATDRMRVRTAPLEEEQS